MSRLGLYKTVESIGMDACGAGEEIEDLP